MLFFPYLNLQATLSCSFKRRNYMKMLILASKTEHLFQEHLKVSASLALLTSLLQNLLFQDKEL